MGLLIFAATNLLGSSGYLAIYLAGVTIGNSQIHQHKNILRLHDSLAWLNQISMFLMLGLLVTPLVGLKHADLYFNVTFFKVKAPSPLKFWHNGQC